MTIRLLAKSRSFSDLPANCLPAIHDNSTFQNSDMRLMILIPESTKRCHSNPTAAKDLVNRIILRIFLTSNLAKKGFVQETHSKNVTAVGYRKPDMGKIEINKRRMSVKDLLVNGGDQTPLQTRQPVSFVF